MKNAVLPPIALLVLFAITGISLAWSAWSETNSDRQAGLCRRLVTATIESTSKITSSAVSKTKQYLREVRASKGRRIIAKPAELGEPETQWMGLLTKVTSNQADFDGWQRWTRWMRAPSHWLARLMGQPNYRLTPGTFFYRTGVELPVQSLFKRLRNENMRPTLVTAMLMTAIYTTPITLALDSALESRSQQNTTQIETLIEHDYRFQSILDLRRSGQINRSEAAQAAFLLKMAWEEYWQRFGSLSPEQLLSEDVARVESGHPLYIHLNQLFTRGIEAKPGAQHTSRGLGPLSLEEKRDLLLLTYQSYARAALSVDWLLRHIPARTRIPDWISESISQFENDDFALQVRSRIQSGEISRLQGVKLLQEDISNQLTLAINLRLGITFVIEESGQTITLEMLRDELLGTK
ncbi:MAG: hypothetical protein IPJ71_15355 [Bdellovibrionales bacterium]|nr:hypothetical protein [Bdellovibrionales bacterium]